MSSAANWDGKRRTGTDDREWGMSSNSHVAENGRECDYMFRAALTGKHDTLVRRAPGWQGALRTSVSCLPVNAALLTAYLEAAGG